MDWTKWKPISGQFVEYDGERWRYRKDEVPGTLRLYTVDPTASSPDSCRMVVSLESVEQFVDDTWYGFFGDAHVFVRSEFEDFYYILGDGFEPPPGVGNGYGDRDGWGGVVPKGQVRGLGLRRTTGSVSLVPPPPFITHELEGSRLVSSYVLYRGARVFGSVGAGKDRLLHTSDQDLATQHDFRPVVGPHRRFTKWVPEDEIITVTEDWLTVLQGERLSVEDVEGDCYVLGTGSPEAAQRLGFQQEDGWKRQYVGAIPQAEVDLQGVRVTYLPPEGYDPYAAIQHARRQKESQTDRERTVLKKWWHFW